MKKIFLFSLLLLVSVFFATGVFADAPQARTADETNYIVGVSHVNNGRTLIIDNEGAAYTREIGNHTIASQWGDGIVYTGECVVHAVIVQSATADAYAAVYDALSATGTAKADPQSATAKQIAQADLKGSLFSTGIYVNATGGEGIINSDVLVTVVYDAL